MTALLQAELVKLRSTRTALGLLIAALLVSVVPSLLLAMFTPADQLSAEENGMLAFVGTAPAIALVPLITLVFGILGMTNEYRHGTITYTYLATPRRGYAIAVKLAVYAVVGALVMLVMLALALGTAALVLQLRGVELDLTTGAVDTGDILEQLALLLLMAGLLTAFGVGLGALFRNQPITVAGTLIWALGIENTVYALKPAVGRWLPFQALTGVAGGLEDFDAALPTLSRSESLLLSLAYIGAVSVAALYLSLRRDVT